MTLPRPNTWRLTMTAPDCSRFVSRETKAEDKIDTSESRAAAETLQVEATQQGSQARDPSKDTVYQRQNWGPHLP